jgi:hypothetical protein
LRLQSPSVERGDAQARGFEMRAYLGDQVLSSRRSRRARIHWLAAPCVAILALTTLQSGPAAGATAAGGKGAAVISDWNAIAVATLSGDTSKQPVETILYTAFVQAAVYDAVVGIDGRYAPYRFHARAPHGTSVQAAVVAAAHRVLVKYSPYAQAALDAAYRASLAGIPNGKAKTRGIAFGTRAANNLIRLRAHDGRNAPILFTKPPAPGVWRPTPPALLPMSAPWLGFVTPLLVRSATQFGPDEPPPALTSARYTRAFSEVKTLGSATSSHRTARQTSTAMFFSGSALAQFNGALQDQVTVRHLDIVDAARMVAAIDMSVADSIISVWHAKYRYGFWRPITAINLADTDGNPATHADPAWVPLIDTPPYPDYPSGYNAFAATVSRALEKLFGSRHLNLTLTSTAVPDVRHYDSGNALRQDVVNARIWLGIHFRFADATARDMGIRLAEWTTGHYFQPAGHG